jgi:hypothetical protein
MRWQIIRIDRIFCPAGVKNNEMAAMLAPTNGQISQESGDAKPMNHHLAIAIDLFLKKL